MASYASFAQFYDGLMENAEYQKRCDYILQIADNHKHNMGLTLDLACGTGSLTRELCRRGVDVFGIDASDDMLCEAMALSAEQDLNIMFLKQKMQNLNLYGTIDTCVCTLDSINHLTNADDVRKTFDKVGLFMDNDGLFIFDVNTLYKHRTVLADNSFVLENDKVFCVWQNTLLDDDIVNISLDFFEKVDNVYIRSSESFSERAYSSDLLCEYLKSAGFVVEAIYGDLTFEPPEPDEQRLIFVARMVKSRNAVS